MFYKHYKIKCFMLKMLYIFCYISLILLQSILQFPLQLQCMLNICYEYCKALDHKFIVCKSNRMVVVTGDNESMPPSMIL